MKTNQEVSFYTFQVPTQATNLEPIFILEFALNDAFPSLQGEVKIKLNPVLASSPDYYKKDAVFTFSETGHCHLMHQDENQFFIKGELKLSFQRSIENGLINGLQCSANLTFGQVNNEINYLKGTFKLVKEKERVLCL